MSRDYIPDGPLDDGDEPDDGTYGGSYCRHGVYVGTPGGADYMCGRCEMGDDDDDDGPAGDYLADYWTTAGGDDPPEGWG
jgi:hypothetical protein